jgi:hypothetical protein
MGATQIIIMAGLGLLIAAVEIVLIAGVRRSGNARSLRRTIARAVLVVGLYIAASFAIQTLWLWGLLLAMLAVALLIPITTGDHAREQRG